MIKLDADQVRRLRMRAQGLDQPHGEAGWGLVEAASHIGGAQAQDINAAGLSLRLRSPGLTRQAVDCARMVERTLAWSWTLRGTLHLMDARDLSWLVKLLGPRFIAGNRPRYRQLGLDEAGLERGSQVICTTIQEKGPQTRAGLEAVLNLAGISAEGQRLPHLIATTALQGLICRGSEVDGEPAFALVSEWIRDGVLSDDPLGELARRYLGAYAPASPADLAAWSGLSLAEARRGLDAIAGETLEVQAASARAWILRDQEAWVEEALHMEKAAPQVRLLPWFDTFLMGYAGRDLLVEPAHWKRVNRGGGMLHPTILVDGRLMGIWRAQSRRGSLRVVLEPFEPLAASLRLGLEAEAADIGRYLGVKVELQEPDFRGFN